MLVKFRSNGRKLVDGSFSEKIDCDIYVEEDLSDACICVYDEEISYIFDISKELKSIINKDYLKWEIFKIIEKKGENK